MSNRNIHELLSRGARDAARNPRVRAKLELAASELREGRGKDGEKLSFREVLDRATTLLRGGHSSSDLFQLVGTRYFLSANMRNPPKAVLERARAVHRETDVEPDAWRLFNLHPDLVAA